MNINKVGFPTCTKFLAQKPSYNKWNQSISKCLNKRSEENIEDDKRTNNENQIALNKKNTSKTGIWFINQFYIVIIEI